MLRHYFSRCCSIRQLDSFSQRTTHLVDSCQRKDRIRLAYLQARNLLSKRILGAECAVERDGVYEDYGCVCAIAVEYDRAPRYAGYHIVNFKPVVLEYYAGEPGWRMVACWRLRAASARRSISDRRSCNRKVYPRGLDGGGAWARVQFKDDIASA